MLVLGAHHHVANTFLSLLVHLTYHYFFTHSHVEQWGLVVAQEDFVTEGTGINHETLKKTRYCKQATE